MIAMQKNGVRIGMDVMLSDYRHWLEYDSVALAVLLVGIGLVEIDRAAHLRMGDRALFVLA